jgi:FkbM family methyltransferase
VPQLAHKLAALQRFRTAFGGWNALKLGLGVLSGRKLQKLNIAGLPHPLFVRPLGSDRHVLEQVFHRREGVIRCSNHTPVIIDAGANVGYMSLALWMANPNARILAIEPEPKNFGLLKQNCQHYPNIELIQAAIWNRETTLRLQNPSAASWAFSFAEGTGPASIEVPTVTPAMLLERLGSNARIDLFKIDIEGAERELFQADDLSWLDRVDIIAVETHERFTPGSKKAVLDAIAPRAKRIAQDGEYEIFYLTDHT